MEYSTDGGSSWTSAATLSGSARLYSWTVPDVVTGKAFVRVTRDGVSGQNQLPFSIVQVPANLLVAQACPGFIRLEWDAVPGALAYDVFLLGEYYMDSIGTTADLFFDAQAINNNPTLDHWFSVPAVGGDGLRGRRAIAVPWDQGLLNCPLQTDLAITKILSPNNALSLCGAATTEVTVEVWNNGLTDRSDPEIGSSSTAKPLFRKLMPALSSAEIRSPFPCRYRWTFPVLEHTSSKPGSMPPRLRMKPVSTIH